MAGRGLEWGDKWRGGAYRREKGEGQGLDGQGGYQGRWEGRSRAQSEEKRKAEIKGRELREKGERRSYEGEGAERELDEGTARGRSQKGGK